MAGRGIAYDFHGAWGTRERAERKARALKRRGRRPFVRRIRVRGDVRYVVMTERR